MHQRRMGGGEAMSSINPCLRNQSERVKWIVSGLDYEKLTPWEEQFVEDIERKSEFKELSIKQIEIIERIYREKSR